MGSFAKEESLIELMQKTEARNYTLKNETLEYALKELGYSDLHHSFGPINQTLWKNGLVSGESDKIKPGMTIKIPKTPKHAEVVKKTIENFIQLKRKTDNFTYFDLAYGAQFLTLDQTMDFGEVNGGDLFFNNFKFKVVHERKQISIMASAATVSIDKISGDQSASAVGMKEYTLAVGYENWQLRAIRSDSPIFKNLGAVNRMAKMAVNSAGVGYKTSWANIFWEKSKLNFSGVLALPMSAKITDENATVQKISGGSVDLEAQLIRDLKIKNLFYFLQGNFKIQNYKLELTWDDIPGEIKSTSFQTAIAVGLKYYLP